MSDQRARLEDLPLLRFLPADVRKLVIDSFVPVWYTFGQTIVREGDAADAFFVVVAGQARVIKKGQNGEEVPLNVIRGGDSFGETALLEDIVRTATVRASGDVEAFKLDRSVFAAMVQGNPELRGYLELQSRHRKLYNFFRLNTPFDELPLDALTLMLSQLEVVSARAGDRIVRAGEPPGPMYFVEDGRLRVFVGEDGNRRYLAYLRKGDFFGEKSLLTGTPRSGSVEAVSDCKLLRLNPATFASLLAGSANSRRRSTTAFRSTTTSGSPGSRSISPRSHCRPRPLWSRSGTTRSTTAEDGQPDAPFASREGFFIKKGKRIRRMTVVRQIDEMDCGAASLAMVCRHFGER